MRKRGAQVPVIAVDGPSAVGKGTISRALAAHLGWHLLDSGALYRLTGLAATRLGVDLRDGAAVASAAERMQVRFGSDRWHEQVWLDGHEVTREMRSEAAGSDASRIAVLPAVRAALLGRQRDFATLPGLVADGRDMGSVVFPHAEVKIFLTASAEERVRRRYKQLKDKGVPASLARLSQEIAERDARDTERAAAPLAASPDAVLIDTSNLSIEAVTERILRLVAERLEIEP